MCHRGGGGPVLRPSPAEAGEVAGGARVVLEAARGRQEGVAALDLRHLDAPGPGGGGVRRPDVGGDGMAGGGGRQVHVLAGQGAAHHGRGGLAGARDHQVVVDTVSLGEGSGGGRGHDQAFKVDPELADVGGGGTEGVAAGGGGLGGGLVQVGVVGGGGTAAAQGDGAAYTCTVDSGQWTVDSTA